MKGLELLVGTDDNGIAAVIAHGHADHGLAEDDLAEDLLHGVLVVLQDQGLVHQEGKHHGHDFAGRHQMVLEAARKRDLLALVDQVLGDRPHFDQLRARGDALLVLELDHQHDRGALV